MLVHPQGHGTESGVDTARAGCAERGSGRWGQHAVEKEELPVGNI